MQIPKWALRTGIALAIVIAGVLSGFVFLHTPPGRSIAAAVVEGIVSSDNLTVKIDELSGTLPWSPHAKTVTLSDAKGPWLVLHEVMVSWSPLALVSDDIVAEEVTVGRVELLREPAPSANVPVDDEGGALPTLLIEKLTVGEARIAPEIAGVEGRFSIEGSIDLLDPAERSRFLLKVTELAGGAARVTADVEYEPGKNLLRADAAVTDNANGTLAGMLAMPADTPLSLTMKSDGSLDDWKADLAASGGDALKAAGNATIKRTGAWRELKLAFNSDIGAIGPERLRALIQGRTDIEITASRSDAGAYRVERIVANAPALKLEASGAFDAAAKRAEGIATLSAPNGAAFAPLANVEWRDLTLTAKLQGAWPTPLLLIDLRANDVKAEGIRSGTLIMHGEAVPDREWNDADATVALTGRADLSDLSADDKTIADILGAAAILTFKANQRDGKWTDIVGELAATGATARFAGEVGNTIHGVVSLDAPDLSKAGFVRGALNIRANIDADRATDAWSVEGKGQATNAAFGEAIDGLLAGKQDLNFSLEGDAANTQISSITIQGQGVSLIASGDITGKALDLDAKVTVPNAGLISAEHAGRLEADMHVAGTLDAPRFTGNASLRDGKLYGRTVESLAATLGAANDKGLSRFTVTGDYGEQPVSGAADVAWLNDGGARVDGLDLTFASVALKGGVTISGGGLINGPLKVDAGEIADVAPFIGEDLAGTVAGDLRFAVAGGKQTLAVALAGPHLRVDTLNLATVGVTGSLTDPFGSATSLTARATAASAAVDDFVLEKVSASAQGPLNALGLTLTGNRVDTKIDTTATLRLDQKPNVIAVRTLKLTRYDKIATLTAPVDIALRDGRVLIPAARISAGGGSATISGDAGSATDLNVTANALPLWVAAFVADPVPVVGTASGTARIRQGGAVDFDVKVVNLAPESQPRIVRNVTLTATGRSDRGAVNFKLTLADAARTSFTADGRVPFARDGALSINAKGSADLALANAYLSVTGDRARGTVTVSARVSGTRAAPQIEGNGKISDGFFRSAASGFELKDITADFIGSNRRVAVSNLNAKSANNGTLIGSGDIALAPDAGYPINLSLKATNAQLVSTELTTVIADVDVRMAGGLLRQPTISGSADVDLWEIKLPDRLVRPLTPIRVTHRNAPPHVLANLPASGEAEEEATSLQFALDVTVRAPRRVHLRGQGIDAEFGGEVKVTNTVDAPNVNGRFDLRRGSVSLLNERVALTSGRVSFFGDVTPTIDVAGEIRRSDFTATVAVKGKASAPEITLSSVPTLPQDEILARVFFNKPTQQLSAFEAAQLAGSIARWSGLSSGPGVLDRLRNALGIDSLASVTDTGGGSAVGAGNYIGDNVYFGFVQGTDTTAGRATVDVELTDEIKLRGEAGPSGDTRLGVAAEWEY